MKELLEQVNDINGIEGCMVITHDGIMAMSAMGPNLDEDTVAALSSSLLITLGKAFEPLDWKIMPQEVILTADAGKLVFFDLGRAYLVVVTDPQLRLDTGLVDLRGKARKLKERTQLQS